MMVHGKRAALRGLLAILFLASAVAASAQSGSGTYYDPALLGQASAALSAGETERALSLYCAMLRPPSQGDLWTVSVVLFCDAADLKATVAQIERPAPVFVQEREFGGRRCYRVCAGLTASRAQASRWVSLLPPSLQPQGPFPARVIFPCSKEPAPSDDVAPPPAPEPQPTPPAPGAGREFLGPPVKVPPEPPAKPPSVSPGPVPADASAGAAAPAGKEAEAESWFRKGVEAYRSGNRLDAYSFYEKALALEPDRPETLNNLGVLYLEDRRFAEAQPLFQKAVRLSPAYAAAHLNLAGALWGLKRFDDAIQEAREASILDPQNVNADLTLASFLLAAGRKEEAAKAAKQALLLDPQNERAKVFLEAAQTSR